MDVGSEGGATMSFQKLHPAFAAMTFRHAVCIVLLSLGCALPAHAQTIATLKGHQHTITSLAYAPDGKTIASGSKDETVILWDVAQKKPRATLGGHKDMVITVRFAPDGKTLGSVSHDNRIFLWDVATGAKIGDLFGHDKDVRGLAFHPHGV